MVHQPKWHVVVVGKKPGVYSSWIEAGPKTKNIPGGAIFQSFLSEDEAIRVFEAAKARGEVRAYPDAGKRDESKNAPLSPLGVEAALLRTPSDSKEDVESTGMQTSLSSSVQSRISKLRRALRDSTDPSLTPSSPPTGVTQRYAPLYEEDDSPPNSPAAQPSPHFTFTSSDSGAYLVVSDEHALEAGTGEMPFQLGVSDWSSPSPTPSSSDSRPGAEEHTSKPPGCMPLHPEPPQRSIGVKYQSLTDLADTESVDSRVWLPKSRVFDPDKVKPRPLTRPSSPAKTDTSPVPSHQTVRNSPQLPRQIPLVDSPFVRVDRGRYSRLSPNLSSPTLQDRGVEDNCSDFGPRPTQLLENYRTDKGKERELDFSVRDRHLAEGPTGYGPSPRNDGRSHVQLVPRDGRGEQSAIMVHCPPNCPHETCYRRPLVLSVPTIEPSRPTGPRYVDACVSPIITITSRIHDTDRLAKIRSKRLDLDGGHPYDFAGFTHVSHKGIAPETDVRSPIVRSTMVPMNAAEMGRIRWKNASRARRLACLTGLLALSDLACFSVALAVTVLTHVFWALQNTVWTTVSSTTGFLTSK